MSDLRTGDEVEVFGQRGHVNRVETDGGEEIVRAEVQHKVQEFATPLWRGWFVVGLLTKIEPPPPEPHAGELWEHISGEDRLFFYRRGELLLCVNQDGESGTWSLIQDKHYYSKVEA